MADVTPDEGKLLTDLKVAMHDASSLRKKLEAAEGYLRDLKDAFAKKYGISDPESESPTIEALQLNETGYSTVLNYVGEWAQINNAVKKVGQMRLVVERAKPDSKVRAILTALRDARLTPKL